jgi:hypothetical protein
MLLVVGVVEAHTQTNLPPKEEEDGDQEKKKGKGNTR